MPIVPVIVLVVAMHFGGGSNHTFSRIVESCPSKAEVLAMLDPAATHWNALCRGMALGPLPGEGA